MKILFLVPYPVKESPSQRFRFEQYFEILRAERHSIEVQSFLQSKNWKLLFEAGHPLLKMRMIIAGFVRRFAILFRVYQFDRILIHREAAPIGPPIFEWIIAKVLKKKIIFDFDDAIWLTDRGDEPSWMKMLRWRRKVKSICQWSYIVSAGNEYLCNFARHLNVRVVFNPSTIDTSQINVQTRNEQKTVVGWTGSHSTLKYLKELEPVLHEIERKNPAVQILVIADRPPELSLKTLRFVKWSSETEIKDLSAIDIGIMPLPDDEWSKGKCGFKALQYMSLGKPALVSPVGANIKIVDHGVNGYHCASDHEWLKYMEDMINDKELRDKLGENGREKVVKNYSVASNSSNFLSLFE